MTAADRKPAAALARKVTRFAALPREDRSLFLEAWARLAAARLLRREPRLDEEGAMRSADGGAELERLERLFLLAVRNHPGVVGCVPRSRALAGFLARRGYGAELCVGLRRAPGGRLEGHAWAEVGGRAVGETPEQEGFSRLVRKP